jgi:hypothetical protein
MKSRGNNRNGKRTAELSAQMIDIIGANNQAHSRLNRNVRNVPRVNREEIRNLNGPCFGLSLEIKLYRFFNHPSFDGKALRVQRTALVFGLDCNDSAGFNDRAKIYHAFVMYYVNRELTMFCAMT